MLMQVEIKGLSFGEDRLDLRGMRAALGCGSRNREEGKENLFHARHHSPEGRSSTTGRRAELFTAKIAKGAKALGQGPFAVRGPGGSRLSELLVKGFRITITNPLAREWNAES